MRRRRSLQNWGRVADVGREGLATVAESTAAMTDAKSNVVTIAQNFLQSFERAQAIGEITSTVVDIAEQTNVVALNAAIETCRAGAHGKFFSVVAGEVKSLALHSKEDASQISASAGQQANSTAQLREGMSWFNRLLARNYERKSVRVCEIIRDIAALN